MVTRVSQSRGVERADRLYCWGKDAAGPMGLGDTVDHDEPVLIEGEVSWAGVATGCGDTCAVTTAQEG